MKKKSIKKLSLNKNSISELNTKAIKGGNGDSEFFCQSEDICATIDYARCRGELQCQIYAVPTDQPW
ncbi:hypothetical protein EZY14_002135 [Kordia sp. TARA_039_SRF]|nr:hypothetical protein EZY14_002135 [Kordia sp. TARA_039_SRF]